MVNANHGEGGLQEYGHDEFKQFFTYVCSLEHVKLLDIENEQVDFHPTLSGVVHRRLKQALKIFVWGNKNDCLSAWFDIRDPDKPGMLDTFQKMDDGTKGSAKFKLQNSYSFTFSDGNNQRTIEATLNEEVLYKSIYTDETLYTAIGEECCVAIDVSLAKGGPEAIAESYYSVMSSQISAGGQSNETLALRLVLLSTITKPE